MFKKRKKGKKGNYYLLPHIKLFRTPVSSVANVVYIRKAQQILAVICIEVLLRF